MTTPTSFRTSFAERNSKTHELRKDSLFNMVDETKSGSIDKAEFSNLFDVIRSEAEAENNEKMAMAKKQAATKRKTKLFGCVAAVMGVFLAVSVAANFAVIFSVVDGAMKTSVSTTGFLEVKGSDQIVQTAEATESVPMIAAGILPMEQLAAVKSLKVTYQDGTDAVEAQMSIAGVRKHNSTYVEFITTIPGEVVQILNGQSTLIKNPTFANGLTVPRYLPICSANAECSAFHTTGVDADALVDQALLELANAGFFPSDPHQRKLYWACISWCNSGNWVSTPYTFGSGSGSGRVKDVTIRYYTDPKGLTNPNGYAARHVVYLLHGMGGTGQGLALAVANGFDKAEYVNFVFVFPTSCETDPLGLGMNTWNPNLIPWGAEGYNMVSFSQIWSLYQWLGGVTGSYSSAAPSHITNTITLATKHPAAKLSGTNGHNGCWSRQLAIGWSDGGRLAIQMNLYNRMTAVDSAVGIAGHPYMHVSTFDQTMSANYDHYNGLAAEQGDTRCSGYSAPWWCDAGDEGTRNGGIYGNDQPMDVRVHTYYAENDYFWARGDDNPGDWSWWAAQRTMKEVADQMLRCGDPTNAWPDCYVWPHGGCDDPSSAHNPCGSAASVTWPLYASDVGTSCSEGANSDECRSRRREWNDDCQTTGLYGDYCGMRMVEEIFVIGGSHGGMCSSSNCNGANANTLGNSGDIGPNGPWGNTGFMVTSMPSHVNFLSDGALVASILQDSMWQFIADMTGDGTACGGLGDKFCCVQVSTNYTQVCNGWFYNYAKPWWQTKWNKHAKAIDEKKAKSFTITGSGLPREKGKNGEREGRRLALRGLAPAGGHPPTTGGKAPFNTVVKSASTCRTQADGNAVCKGAAPSMDSSKGDMLASTAADSYKPAARVNMDFFEYAKAPRSGNAGAHNDPESNFFKRKYYSAGHNDLTDGK